MALLLPRSPRRLAGHVGSPGRERGRINRIDPGLYFILAVALIGRFSCGVSEVWVATPLGTEFVGHELRGHGFRLRISAPPSWESPEGKLAKLHSKKLTGRQDLLCTEHLPSALPEAHVSHPCTGSGIDWAPVMAGSVPGDTAVDETDKNPALSERAL